ncbi:MAG: thioredoxin fold domain-containing protein [Betaproteobacteria bacterium]|nr:thioredoxin fold domain-containing protein [Betaproteobacteria bacterium]
MKKLLLLLYVFQLALSAPSFAATAPGRATGGQAHVLPGWFKSSFLNFKDEVDEARKAGRHILVFMDLNDCPYCARTLDENFRQGGNMEFIRKNFDVIAVNIRGANEVVWIDQATYTEQELAAKLKIVGTPALVFINPDGNKVLQLNGYRTPPTLRHALEYVRDKAYRNQSLAAYIEKQQQTPVYTFRDHPRFEKITNFANYLKPLAVIFEDRNCADCDSFHSKVLNHPEVLAELKPFQVVRLDAYSEIPITDISGRRTTPRGWAASLGLNHRPGVVLFDEGQEVSRLEGRFYHFHFKEMLRFVSGQYYKQYDRFGSYLNQRQSELLQQGVNIDFSE